MIMKILIGIIKVIVSIVIVAILLVLVTITGWKLHHRYYEPKRLEAMNFCESLVPLLKSYKNQKGEYPTHIDPAWIKEKNIPQLIRTNDFYLQCNFFTAGILHIGRH